MKRFRVMSVGMIVPSALIVVGVLTGTLAGASGTNPTVTFVSPEHGPLGGGTLVNIEGTNLAGVTGVTFGSTASPDVIPRSNNLVRAVAPQSASAGPVNIEVTTSAGTSTPNSNDEFTYVTGPTIQSVYPKGGATRGGNNVTISGAGFSGVTAVDFGTTPAESFKVDSPNAITAVTPPGAAGTVLVSVTGAGGSTPSDPADEFTYMPRLPEVTSVVFDVGNVAGGNLVTILGEKLQGVTEVDFGADNPASGVQYRQGVITAVAPPGPPGVVAGSPATVEITVTTNKGTSALNPPMDEYMYVANGPS